MKRLLLLTLLLMLYSPAALAQDQQVAINSAKSLLTEVYGYTAQEADTQFDFQAEESGGQRNVSFAPKAHPDWQYTAVFASDGTFEGAQTPFKTGFANYPGESTVRDILRQAADNGWFSHWDSDAQTALLQAMEKNELTPTDALAKAISTGQMTAAQAINGFFLSCYGSEEKWPVPLRQWRDEVLTANGLSLEDLNIKTDIDTPITYVVMRPHAIPKVTVTEFGSQAPAELMTAFQNENLKGWVLHCGAVAFTSDSIASDSTLWCSGLAAFDHEEERLLVMLFREGEEWKAVPVGTKALLPQRELSISYDVVNLEFLLEYPLSDSESEIYRVAPVQDIRLCRLKSYSRYNRSTGEGVGLQLSDSRQAVSPSLEFTATSSEGSVREECINVNVPKYLDYWDITTFPTTLEACRALTGEAAAPEGYGTALGVHLRANTSSRSKDLGLYQSGTLLRVLELLPGDPYEWVHVRIGQMEGYMSGVYVSYPGTSCTMEPGSYESLTVAMNLNPVSLKNGVGWLDGTVAELPAGTKMHVLAQRDDWLHVVVPRDGQLGRMMDVNGTYGYVKAADVTQAATVLQLDWLARENAGS